MCYSHSFTCTKDHKALFDVIKRTFPPSNIAIFIKAVKTTKYTAKSLQKKAAKKEKANKDKSKSKEVKDPQEKEEDQEEKEAQGKDETNASCQRKMIQNQPNKIHLNIQKSV